MIVLSVVLSDCCKSKNGCRDWVFSNSSFSCPCSQNVTHCRKKNCSTCLFKTSTPAVPFWNSKQSQCSLYQKKVPESDSTLHAQPFVAFAEKRTGFAQRSKAFGQAVVVFKILNTVILLSVVLSDCCKPMNSCRDWAFSNSGLEVGLPAFQVPVFAKCDALPKGDLLDMFVEGIYSRHSFLDFQASTPCQKQVPESNSRLHQFCIMLASCPSLRFSTEAEGLVTELWPPRFLTMQWLCSQLCHAANQRAIVELEFLATVGWKCGCQPFSCPDLQNMMHCQKEICSTCLSKKSIPAIPLGNAKHPLLVRSLRFRRLAAHSTSSGLCLY